MTSAAPARWEQLAPDALATELGVRVDVGLDDAEVLSRRARVGKNALPHEGPAGWRVVLLRQVTNFIVLLLATAAALSAALGETADAIAIGVVLVVNTAIGFLMEYRAEREIAALAALAALRARVRREGRVLDLDAEDLVPGDVVLLEPGDRVPADGRLVAGRVLIDESLLTGESVPVEKTPEALPESGERGNAAFAGSLVASGTGTLVVVATGLATELGRLGRLVTSGERAEAPITGRLEALGRVLVGLVALVAGAIVAVGAWQGRPLGQLVEAAVVLAIAAIPEGLPVVATLALAAGARRLTRRGLLLRRLGALEAFGAVTTACLDKTGTLTENAMTVQCLVVDDREVTVSGVGWAPEGAFSVVGAPLDPRVDPGLSALLGAAQRCNDATLERHGGAWHIHGDPSEGALLVAAAKAALADPRAGCRRTRCLSPEPGRPWMLVGCAAEDGEALWAKGAPDPVLARCTAERRGEAIVPFTEASREAWRRRAGELADRPLRVFGVAEGGDVEGGWVWLGLAGMADPPRPGAASALAALRAVGVRPVMLTGDHPRTAVAIARALGLTEDGAPRVAEGVASDVAGADVYARVTPEDKLTLVRRLEARGEGVAMTGDGVNDAPALRHALVGVAMGEGVEAAKEAAAAVLVDARLETLVAGVREGRGAFYNIQKALDYLLTCSAATMGAVLLTTVAGFPLPLAPLQILYLNLLTHSFPALGLALEPADPDAIAAGPVPRRAPLLTGARLGSLGWHAAMIAVVTLAVGAWGLAHESEAHGRTLVFATLASALMLHALADRSARPFGGWRSADGPYFPLLLGAAIALQLAAIYVPALAAALGLTPMGPSDWGAVAGAALGVTLAVELSKWILPPDLRARPPE